MDMNNIEVQLALQCAPFIAGLKISNLLNVVLENEIMIRTFLRNAKLSYFCLLRTDSNVVFLLYHRERLERYLLEDEVCKLLAEEGYDVLNLERQLERLGRRYRRYMRERGRFPHEIGIFLGYPVADVRGFVRHKGKDFLYSGYWKVYDNPKETMKLFRNYEYIKEKIIWMLSIGVSMREIIKIYGETTGW